MLKIILQLAILHFIFSGLEKLNRNSIKNNYTRGLSNLQSTIILPGQAMQIAITLYLYT